MKTFDYRIEYDQLTDNPRNDFDQLATFYSVKNSHYLTGGKKDVEFSYREELEDHIKELRKEKAVIVEFSHNCGTQYAVVERSQLQKEYLDHGYSLRKALYWARRCAESEIETWKAWADSEVYGYIVEDEEGNHLESCWGFYGDSGRDEAEKEAKRLVKHYEEEERKDDELFLARLGA